MCLCDVVELYLNDNLLGDDGVDIICSCDHLSNLYVLNLYQNEIRGRGFKLFSTTKNLPCLHDLNLSYNFPDEDGINALVYNTNLTNLSILDVTTIGNNFTNNFIEKITTKLEWKFKIIFNK